MNQIANPSGALYLIQGEVLYEFNRLDEAENSIRKAIKLCEEQHHAAAIPYCYAQLARIDLAQQNHTNAENNALESMKSLRQLDVPHWVDSFVMAWQIHYSLKKGDSDQTNALLSERNLPLPCQFSYPNETEYLVYARWLAHQNKLDQATSILQQLDEWLVSIDWINLALEVKLGWANLLFSQGDKNGALDILEPALKLAETEGYCRSFLDENGSMQALLKEAKEQNKYPECCSALLLDSSNNKPITSFDGSIEPLSQRELQILRLLKTRLTVVEIAGEIYVSVNTIKTHLKNIYSKLNVHTRNEAIQKAMEMHIL